MTTKTVTVSQAQPASIAVVKKLVTLMTIFAWTALTLGVLMCLVNITHFSDKNVWLMVGLGFMVGSVFIFVIGTAIGLVHARMSQQLAENANASDQNQDS